MLLILVINMVRQKPIRSAMELDNDRVNCVHLAIHRHIELVGSNG